MYSRPAGIVKYAHLVYIHNLMWFAAPADPQNTVLQSLVFWYLWILSQKSQYYFAWKQGVEQGLEWCIAR